VSSVDSATQHCCCVEKVGPQVAPECSGFCCIWNRLFSLFLPAKLLIELLLVCFEQLILSLLFMSGFIPLKPCRQSYKPLPYFFSGNTQSSLIDVVQSVKLVFLFIFLQ